MRLTDLQSTIFDTVHLTRVRTAALRGQLRVAGDARPVTSSAPSAAAELLVATVKNLGQIVDTHV